MIAKARNRISNTAFATKIPDTRSLCAESPEQSAADRSLRQARLPAACHPLSQFSRKVSGTKMFWETKEFGPACRKTTFPSSSPLTPATQSSLRAPALDPRNGQSPPGKTGLCEGSGWRLLLWPPHHFISRRTANRGKRMVYTHFPATTDDAGRPVFGGQK
jgi:hypothetical protein